MAPWAVRESTGRGPMLQLCVKTRAGTMLLGAMATVGLLMRRRRLS